MVAATDTGLIGARDRALILLGFAGAFRRSELVALDIVDRAFDGDGLTVILRRSKVDQEGGGRKIGIPFGANPETCPVRTVQVWLEKAAIGSGPLFRAISRHGRLQAGRLSGLGVARIVKKLAQRAGLDPAKYARALAAGGACDQRCDCGCDGAKHHEPDGAQVRADGTAVHQGRKFVQGE
jgi:integrase